MIKSLMDFLRQSLATPDSNANTRVHTLEVCAAVLMLEVALADSAVDDAEKTVVVSAVQHHFHLDSDEAEALVGLARQQIDHAHSLHDFTKSINSELTREEKTIVIELLWRVAAADSVVHKYEEYFIRKISDLLYVSHKDYIRAKHRASEPGPEA